MTSFFKDLAFRSENDEWETPTELFRHLNLIYSFTLDVCASVDNAKCNNYFTIKEDGLSQEWKGVCWMNPPYGKDIHLWMKKAYESSLKKARVVCLVPARTDTIWWHLYAMKGEINFIRGRLTFKLPGKDKKSGRAPFPSAIIVFNRKENHEISHNTS